MISDDVDPAEAPGAPGRRDDSCLLLLIRHGVTPTTGQVLPGRAPGLHLSEEGREQARTVAERLRGVPVSAIHTSPLERTRETAAPAAEAVGLEPVVDDGLLECEFGQWTGQALADLARLPAWDDVQRRPATFRFPDGESIAEMQERIVGALAAIAARRTGQIVACVSHADPLKAALVRFQGRGLDAFQQVTVDPAAISVVELAVDGTARVLHVNTRTGPLASLLDGR